MQPHLHVFPQIVLVGIALLTAVARAEFVGGVEQFNGTVKDLITWEQRTDGEEVISQNNALSIIDTIGGLDSNSGEYTTRHMALLPGSAVSARVTVGASGVASLFLTTNSRGTTEATAFDSYWTQLVIGADSSTSNGEISRWIGANSSGGSFGALAQVTNVIGQTFGLEIVRPNSTDYIYRAYDQQGFLLGSSTFVGTIAHPEALYISLDGHNGMTATWDDVTVSGNIVPEPALAGLAISLAAAARRSRWRRRTRC